MKIYEKQKGKWKMIETCVVCAMFHVLDMYARHVCASVLFLPRHYSAHAHRPPSPPVVALLFPFQALSIAGKCKQIRKQSLATFSDLT